MSASLIASDLEGVMSANEHQSNLYGLIASARAGDIGGVTRLLGKVDDVNACNPKGFTALHAAVFSGNKSLIQTLLDSGASVNSQSRTGLTPLHVAVQENFPDVVQLLVSNGADKNLKDENGTTALGIAKRDQLKSVSSILSSDESSKKVRLPPLHSAAKKNDHMTVFSLLTDKTRHPNVNETNQIGLTALHIAAQYGSTEVARLLLANGARVDFSTKGGITPLHVASKWGKHEIVSLLINHKALINCFTNDLLTPLHCSARSGHILVLELLLKASADLTLKTRNGLTPLHMAAQGDHDEVAKLLLSNGAPKDDLTFDQLTPLHVSAHCGSAKVAQVLLEWRCLVDPNAMNGFTPLHVACRKNRIRVVELLVRYGANIDAFTESGLTPLHIATLLDHSNVVAFLLDHKADPNARCKTGMEETPLHLASATNNLDVVRELLVSGAKLDVKNRALKTPLHTACEYGNLEVVKLLLQRQTPHSPSSPRMPSSPLSSLVNDRAAEDYTPLHYACIAGREELVDLLLEHGGDVDALTKRGFNCIHLAAKSGKLAILEKLLNRSPDSINTPGTNRLTPLHIATHYKHHHVVRYLVRRGADLDARAKNGYTPLHIAAKRDNLDAAEVLVESGSKINLLSKNGFSPLHLSVLEGHQDMTSFLLRRGADPNLRGLDGLTPLHVAVQEDWMPIVQLLLASDIADVNAQSDNGFTPLHLSSHYGFLNSSKMLIDKGASTAIRNKHGNNPLHLAVQEGHLHVVEVLSEDKHCDLESMNEQHFNPMMIAKKYGFANIKRVLMDKGADPDVKVPPEEYRKDEPETTHKKFDDSSSTTSENMSKSREAVSQENSTRVVQTPKVRDYLDFDRLMFSDVSGRTPDLKSYDVHLSYTSPQTSGAFADASEMTFSAPPPSTPMTGSLPEYPLESPFYSPSFKRVPFGEESRARPDDLKELEDEAELMIEDVAWRERSRPREGERDSTRNDRRRETWLGVLEKHSEEEDAEGKLANGVAITLANDVKGSRLPKRDQENRSVMRGEPRRTSSKIAMERRSYIPPLGSLKNFDGFPVVKGVEKKQSQLVVSASQLPYKGFLKSFIVDARGCVAVGGRHSGVRFIIPPGAVLGPTRITCQLIRSEKLPYRLALSDGEAHVARIHKMSSDVPEFYKPIVMEMPHFGVLKSHNREIYLLNSVDGKGWMEHQEAKGDDFRHCPNDLEPADKIFDSSVHCVALRSLPSYMSLVSRVKKDSSSIGSDGGSITSSLCPQIRVVFPEGAVNKTTNVGLQVFRVDKDLNSKHSHESASDPVEYPWSPVASIEPGSRKFHKPVKLTIPLPSNHKGSSLPKDFRLLYSLGTKDSKWTDISNLTSMDISNGRATFETGVSARFCIVEEKHKDECLQKLPSLLETHMKVPMLARFAVFGKRRSQIADQVKLRVLCLTEPKERQILEEMQNFQELAKGPLVELTEGEPVSILLSENLELARDEEELQRTGCSTPEPLVPFITCEGMYNTRMPLLVKTETSKFPVDGHVRFACGSEEEAPARDDRLFKRQTSFHDDCILAVSIPDYPEKRGYFPLVPQVSRVDAQNYYYKKYRNGAANDDDDLRGRSLKLTYISEQLGGDWERLAHILGFDHNEIEDIKESYSIPQEQALVFLQKWSGGGRVKAVMKNDLERSLKQIGRLDVILRGLYSEGGQYDEDDVDNFVLRYVDTDSNDYELHGKASPGDLLKKHILGAGKVAVDEIKRSGIVAGVKRHDGSSDKGSYERLVYDDDDSEAPVYSKLRKVGDEEKGRSDDALEVSGTSAGSEVESDSEGSDYGEGDAIRNIRTFYDESKKGDLQKDVPDLNYGRKNSIELSFDSKNRFDAFKDDFEADNSEEYINVGYNNRRKLGVAVESPPEPAAHSISEPSRRSETAVVYELEVPRDDSRIEDLEFGVDKTIKTDAETKPDLDINENIDIKTNGQVYPANSRQTGLDAFALEMQESSGNKTGECFYGDAKDKDDEVVLCKQFLSEISVKDVEDEKLERTGAFAPLEIKEAKSERVSGSGDDESMIEVTDVNAQEEIVVSERFGGRIPKVLITFEEPRDEHEANEVEIDVATFPTNEEPTFRAERRNEADPFCLEEFRSPPSDGFTRDENENKSFGDVGSERYGYDRERAEDVNPALETAVKNGKKAEFGPDFFPTGREDFTKDDYEGQTIDDGIKSQDYYDVKHVVDYDFDVVEDFPSQYKKDSRHVGFWREQPEKHKTATLFIPEGTSSDTSQAENLYTTRDFDIVEFGVVGEEKNMISQKAPIAICKFLSDVPETSSTTCDVEYERKESLESPKDVVAIRLEPHPNVDLRSSDSTETWSRPHLTPEDISVSVGGEEEPSKVEHQIDQFGRGDSIVYGCSPPLMAYESETDSPHASGSSAPPLPTKYDTYRINFSFVGRDDYDKIQDQDVARVDKDRGKDRLPAFEVANYPEERVDSFTISSDSEGDFKDLHEEYSQKYLQRNVDISEAELSGDPVDRLLYCYDATAAMGRVTCADVALSQSERGSSLGFMPDFDPDEPSVDLHKEVITRAVVPRREIDLELSEGSSGRRQMPEFRIQFSEDNQSSFDSYEAGPPASFRESNEELPDGYVVSRQTTAEIGSGVYGERLSSTDDDLLKPQGTVENVFERIPGATGKGSESDEGFHV